MADDNPYAAPRTQLADVLESAGEGNFVPEGQALTTGSGLVWIAQGWQLFKK